MYGSSVLKVTFMSHLIPNFQALQYLQKSHRCATQAVNWERDVDNCRKVLKQSSGLLQGGVSDE